MNGYLSMLCDDCGQPTYGNHTMRKTPDGTQKWLCSKCSVRKRTRISWDAYWMRITKDIALRSTCLRRQFGALIIKNNTIIGSGYNGAPRGAPHCLDVGCIRDKLNIPHGERYEVCVAVHAEQNALLQAGRDAEGATLYVNGTPCPICAKMIVNARIARVVMPHLSDVYRDRLEWLEHTNIEITYEDGA